MTTKEASQRLAAATEVMSETPGVIHISGEITEKTFKRVSEKIIQANREKTLREIWLCINSEGGSLTTATGLIDLMEWSKIPINTVGFGDIASAAFMIFIAGKKRVMSPSALAMSHQYSWDIGGSYEILKSTRKAADAYNAIIFNIIKKYTSLKTDEAARRLNLAEGEYLTPQESLDIGVCDSIDLSEFKIKAPIKRRTK